jgi:hypothetical protein
MCDKLYQGCGQTAALTPPDPASRLLSQMHGIVRSKAVLKTCGSVSNRRKPWQLQAPLNLFELLEGKLYTAQ